MFEFFERFKVKFKRDIRRPTPEIGLYFKRVTLLITSSIGVSKSMLLWITRLWLLNPCFLGASENHLLWLEIGKINRCGTRNQHMISRPWEASGSHSSYRALSGTSLEPLCWFKKPTAKIPKKIKNQIENANQKCKFFTPKSLLDLLDATNSNFHRRSWY